MDHNFRVLLNSRKLFFGTMALVFISAVISLLLFGNTAGYIPQETVHPFWLNVFFINYTFMADGIFVLSLSAILIFWFKRKQEGMMLLYAFLISEVFVQVLYNLDHSSGLGFLLEKGQSLFSADHRHDGFISGHTTVAFAIASALILKIKNAKWQLPLLFAALLLGFSRIYLAKHFLLDVLVGSVAGTFSGITAVYLCYYFKGSGYYFKKLFNQNTNIPSSSGRNIQPV